MVRMVRYLKKKKLYEIAKSLIKEELPLCKDCKYTFYRGSEWLVCDSYKISSLACGAWIHINLCRFDEETDDFVYEEEIYSNFWDGKYHYHSINGKPVAMDVS